MLSKTLRIGFISFLLSLPTIGFTQNNISIGIGVDHLYDIYEGPDELSNSFIDIDLKGLNGDYTKFDVAFGINAQFDIAKMSGIGIGFTSGKMTSQLKNQYSISRVNMFNVTYRQYLTKAGLPKNFYGRLFMEVGVGANLFEGERYFVKDEGLFSKTNGFCINNIGALGWLVNISDHFQATINSSFIINYSDKIDGYAFDSGTDIMLKTGITLNYKL